jgi:hypothetical protein
MSVRPRSEHLFLLFELLPWRRDFQSLHCSHNCVVLSPGDGLFIKETCLPGRCLAVDGFYTVTG